MQKTLHPIIKWAQRKDKIFLQVGIRDIQNQKIQCSENKLDFSCQTPDQKFYEFSTEFYAQVDPSTSKWTKTGFHLLVVVTKKDTTKQYWPRLTSSTAKSSYIQCDWDKWIDEDQEQQQGNKGLGGFDPDKMQSFNDSDDDEQEQKKEKYIDDLDVDKPVQEQPTGSSA